MTLAGKWKQETAENLDDYLIEMGQFFNLKIQNKGRYYN